MTQAQKKQFNRMRAALIVIHKEYMTPDQMHKYCKKTGWDFNDTQGMAYENIQMLAKSAVKGVKEAK
jgi:hypothetical protein